MSARKAWTSINSRARPLRALRPPEQGPASAGLWILVIVIALFGRPTASASASGADDYANAIHRALTLVQFAERGDSPSANQAVVVLKDGTGNSQPEILADLRAEPPRLVDADRRLQAIYTALQARVDTPDPSGASRHLHQILSSPRYAGMSTQPSLLDRIASAIRDLIRRLLLWLGGQGLGLGLPILVLVGLVILAITVLVVRRAMSPHGREAGQHAAAAGSPAPLDFFHEADRLAAAGDYPGALRMLAGGVAIRIGGEQAWMHSPFTVRELFARSPRAETLRPLLLSFEEAIYGHRPADAAAYARAAEAAAPYRKAAA